MTKTQAAGTSRRAGRDPSGKENASIAKGPMSGTYV
jgi:hypothetical protein